PSVPRAGDATGASPARTTPSPSPSGLARTSRSARVRTHCHADPCTSKPTHVGDWHRIVGLATQLPDARGAGVDVVDLEVRARASLPGLHVGDGTAGPVADLGHVVLGRPRECLE